MAKSTELLAKLEQLDLQRIKEQTAQETVEQAADLNRAQLFQRGEDSQGRKLSKYRNARYARYKNQRNPQPGLGNPDAYLTGDLFRRLKMAVAGNLVTFDSDSPHAVFMVRRDGPQIFGLTDDSMQRYRAEVYYPAAVDKIKAITGLP